MAAYAGSSHQEDSFSAACVAGDSTVGTSYVLADLNDNWKASRYNVCARWTQNRLGPEKVARCARVRLRVGLQYHLPRRARAKLPVANSNSERHVCARLWVESGV